MYTGKQLGDAIASAIEKKGVKKAQVARDFGIKQPSLNDWIKTGRIGKEHIGKLIEYFSDIVEPSHFGIDNLVLKNKIYSNQGGTQNNVGGNQTNYTNNFLSKEPTQTLCEELSKGCNDDLTSMPVFDIDNGVRYAINPKEKIGQISEHVSTLTHHTNRAFALKLTNEVLGITAYPLLQNDVLIVEPLIPPRDKDFVLIGLNFGQPDQRGLLARLHIDIENRKTIKFNDTPAAPLPKIALICGVVVEIKRRLLPNDLIQSRIDLQYEPSVFFELKD